MMLRSRRKLKRRSNLPRRRKINLVSLIKNPAIHLNQKLKKSQRNQLKLTFSMLLASQILHQLLPKANLSTCSAWLKTLLQSKNQLLMCLICLGLQKTTLNLSHNPSTYLFPPIKRCCPTTIWACLNPSPNLSPIPTNSHLKARFLRETTSQQG